ncbi:MAG: hypothetical protein M3R55_15345, partial [Acidobacteriota bacterium]|nr:hypothetical protein [Acidobacteriota bacterium]
VMPAHAEIIKLERVADCGIDRFDGLPRLRAAGDVRLIGDDDEQEAGAAKSVDGFACARAEG